MYLGSAAALPRHLGGLPRGKEISTQAQGSTDVAKSGSAPRTFVFSDRGVGYVPLSEITLAFGQRFPF